MQPVQEPRLAGRFDRGVDQLTKPLPAAEAKLAQGVTPRRPIAGSYGGNFVAFGIVVIRHGRCIRNIQRNRAIGL